VVDTAPRRPCSGITAHHPARPRPCGCPAVPRRAPPRLAAGALPRAAPSAARPARRARRTSRQSAPCARGRPRPTLTLTIYPTTLPYPNPFTWLQAPCREQRRQRRVQHGAHAVPAVGQLHVRGVARVHRALAAAAAPTLALARKGAWCSSAAGAFAWRMGLRACTDPNCRSRPVAKRAGQVSATCATFAGTWGDRLADDRQAL